MNVWSTNQIAKYGAYMKYPELEALIAVIQKLRDPNGGCPWDLKQTHETLLKYLIEESYEFIAAVEGKNQKEMCEELGDVLLQVILHATIAEQSKNFNLEQVAKGLKEKLIVRHPHVFGDTKVSSSDEVVENWQKIKAETKGKVENFIGEKDLALPALMSANHIGKKTREIKFDWDNPSQVAYKVEEEWQELKEELASLPRINKERVAEELGDVLFSMAQLARHLDIDPELALRSANKKFVGRFNKMEGLINKAGLEIKKMNQEQMDVYWLKVKEIEKNK